MSRLFSLLFLIGLSGASFAQEIWVKDICQLTTDISARSEPRLSSDGKDCAIVRVNVPTIKTMDFKDNTVGEISYIAGEYKVYIPEGTKQIPIYVEGYNCEKIDFENFNISVEGKCVYRVTLAIKKEKTTTEQNGGTLKISTQPESTYILLDGIPVGESPLTLENVSAGTHTISFPILSYYSLPDQTITITPGETLEKDYQLVDTIYDDFYIPMESYGGDGEPEGWPLKYMPIKQNGKKGLTDYFDNVIVPCEYDYVNPKPVDGFFIVGLNGDRKILYGIYKPGEGLVIPCIYNDIWWNNPFIIVSQNGYEGIVRLDDGKVILPCIYNVVNPYAAGLYRIKDKEGYQLWNRNNGMYSREHFQSISSFNDDGVAFAEDSKRHLFLVDTLFYTTPLPEEYYEGYKYTEGIMCVKKRGTDKYGVINMQGKELTSFIYDKCLRGLWNHVVDGVIILRRELQSGEAEEYTIVDKNEHSCTFISDDEPSFLADRYIEFYKENKLGLIDFDGNTVLPFEYDIISYKDDDTIEAKKDGMIHLYDLSLKEIDSFADKPDEPDEPEFDEDEYSVSRKGEFCVIYNEKKHRYGYMNAKGEFLTGCIYSSECLEDIYYYTFRHEILIIDDLAILCIGDRFGLIDKNGDIVVPLIYSIILPFEDGTVYARKVDGTWIEMNMDDYHKP
jgi:hypothetical protein